MKRFVLKNGTLVLPDQVIQSDLLVENGLITTIGTSNTHPIDKMVDLDGKFVLAGFIDIHTHGASSFDFTFGTYQENIGSFQSDEEQYLSGLSRALESYISTGCTSIYITSMAAPLSQILKSAKYLNKAFIIQIPGIKIIKGINLEGTFIKMAEYAGAQNPEYFYPPDVMIVEEIQKESGHRLKIVNVPPEHGSCGLDLIHYLRAQKIVVSGGHSGASGTLFDKAIQAGLQIGVHFLNGPSRSSSKGFENGGAVESMLRSDMVKLELILDGYHVHPAYVRDVIARKGTAGVIGITDSMFATGMKHLDQFELLGLLGKVSSNRSYLQVLNKVDTLFGSVLTMDKGFSNVLTWLTQPMHGVWSRNHEARSFHRALIETSWLFSRNPAHVMGIYDSAQELAGTGSIETGKWADLVVADISLKDGQYTIKIEQTISQGILMDLPK